jgi:dTDP-4-amino-4,6-dideoxygalactose transaminase
LISRRNIKLYPGIFKDLVPFFFGKSEHDNYITIFENKFSSYIDGKYAISTQSARQAYLLILESLNIPPGSEILLPAYTIKALFEITTEAGFVARAVDIDLDTFFLDIEDLKRKISGKSSVVVATHMFGSPCDLQALVEVCGDNNLFLVEDCAHAHGSRYNSKKVGTFGIASFFSLGNIKPINAFGGGIIITNNTALYESILKKREKHLFPKNGEMKKKLIMGLLESYVLSSWLFFLFIPIFYFDFLLNLFHDKYTQSGWRDKLNYRFSNIQGLIGLRQLERLDKLNDLRNINSSYIKKNCKQLQFQEELPNTYSTCYFLTVKIPNVNLRKVQKRLLLRGIDTHIGREIADKCHILTKDNAPNCDILFSQLVQIPAYETLKLKKLKKVKKEICNLG